MLIEVLKAFLALGIMGLVFGAALSIAGNVFFVKEEKRKSAAAEPEETKSMVAHVRCHGSHEFAHKKYIYYGMNDCAAASRLLGGYMTCQYGCLGFGNCLKKCPENAISIRNGVAVIDREVCTGCGICLQACPKNVIELIPKDAAVKIDCSNKDVGGRTREACNIGCIGCKLCENNCPEGAIRVDGNVSVIDYDKCVGCGICAANCPRKIIDIAEVAYEE